MGLVLSKSQEENNDDIRKFKKLFVMKGTFHIYLFSKHPTITETLAHQTSYLPSPTPPVSPPHSLTPSISIRSFKLCH